MNKGVLLGLAAVIIVALAAVGYALMNRPETSSPPSPSGAMIDELTQENTPASLRELMQVTANQMCTFSDEDDSSGTIYVGGGKMRGDFTSVSEIETGTHMVSDSANIYMWFDEAPDGFKVSLADIEKFTDFGEDGQKSVDLDQSMDFECSPWAVDNSVFDLPNIEFNDFGAMVQGAGNVIEGDTTEGDSDTRAIQCGACDSLPGDASTQCRQALGC